jgi:hypothetical protein
LKRVEKGNNQVKLEEEALAAEKRDYSVRIASYHAITNTNRSHLELFVEGNFVFLLFVIYFLFFFFCFLFVFFFGFWFFFPFCFFFVRYMVHAWIVETMDRNRRTNVGVQLLGVQVLREFWCSGRMQMQEYVPLGGPSRHTVPNFDDYRQGRRVEFFFCPDAGFPPFSLTIK